MEKNEFIEILNNHAENADIFGGRFVMSKDDNNIWLYVRPAIDCFEPIIDLSTDGVVKHIEYLKTEIYDYYEFIKKYYLIKNPL